MTTKTTPSGRPYEETHIIKPPVVPNWALTLGIVIFAVAFWAQFAAAVWGWW